MTSAAIAESEERSRAHRYLSMDLKALWKGFWAESPSFWFLSFYVFIEYVRPQSVYPVIDVLPWGKLALGLAIGAFVMEGLRSRRLTFLDGFVALFAVIVFASSFAAWMPEWAFDGWTVFFNWLILYYLASCIVTTPRRFLLFLGLFLLWSLKMSQHGARTFVARGGAFASWGATGGPGWFHNSGEFAIQMCIFLPMALYFVWGMRDHLVKWKFYGLMALLPGTAFISLVASSSRGGQIGALAVILYLVVTQSKQKIKSVVISGLVLALLWVVMPQEQKTRFETMGDDETSTTRLTYWEDGMEIARENPLLGIGYENWIPYYHNFYNPRGELPHNIFVEAASELGYSGLAALLLLIGGTFALNYRTRRLARGLPEWGTFLGNAAYGLDAALVGFMASGFFVTVLFYPFLWANLAFTAALYETVRRQRARVRRQPPPVVHRPRRQVASGGGRMAGTWATTP